MATFPDLTDFDHYLTETSEPGSDAATLSLPIRARTYTWRAGDLSLWAMLKLRRLDEQITEAIRRRETGEEVTEQLGLTTAEQRRLDLDLIGKATLQQMSDDGVRWTETQRVAATLLTWHLRGHAAALATWSRGSKEEKPADPPARAASTKTAGSSTRTPRRSGGGSSSGTGRSSKRTSTASTKSTSPAKKSVAATPRAGS